MHVRPNKNSILNNVCRKWQSSVGYAHEVTVTFIAYNTPNYELQRARMADEQGADAGYSRVNTSKGSCKIPNVRKLTRERKGREGFKV